MLWPERPDNWRAARAARPAGLRRGGRGDRAFRAGDRRRLGAAIRRGACRAAAAGAGGRAVERRCLDARCRAQLRGQRRRASCAACIGASMPGAACTGHCRARSGGGAEGAGDRASGALLRAADQRGRRHPRRRPGHGAGHRAMPAQSQPQSGAVAAADRGAAAPLPGRASCVIWLGRRRDRRRDLRVISTTWPASRGPERSA